jgi:hypothetical protein
VSFASDEIQFIVLIFLNNRDAWQHMYIQVICLWIVNCHTLARYCLCGTSRHIQYKAGEDYVLLCAFEIYNDWIIVVILDWP